MITFSALIKNLSINLSDLCLYVLSLFNLSIFKIIYNLIIDNPIKINEKKQMINKVNKG